MEGGPERNYSSYTFAPFADYLSGSILVVSCCSILPAAAHPMLKRRVEHLEVLSTTPPVTPLVRLSYSGFPFLRRVPPELPCSYDVCRNAV